MPSRRSSPKVYEQHDHGMFGQLFVFHKEIKTLLKVQSMEVQT